MTINAARLDDQLCFALYAASNRVTGMYRAILEPLDLTYTQFVVMMALWEQDGVSITELAARTQLSKATMTPLLRKLQSKGYIQLDRVAENDRQKQVAVTAKGKKVALQSVEATEKAFCATGLKASEAATLIKLCNQIADGQ